MGLGFSIYFPVGKKPSIFGNKPNTSKEHYTKYFSELPSVVPGWNPVGHFDDEGFCVKLVPFEEDIYGKWEDGRLSVSARTNGAGPGYHAWLIGIMDGLGVAPVEVEDETGYWDDRDFGLLQNEMANWLKSMSEQLLEMSKTGEYSNISVSMPLDDFPEDSNHFACCPLGYFEPDFFERINNGEAGGEAFFIWWNQKQDALFFRNCALSLILCDNNWLPPCTDKEREIIAATLHCLETAYDMDPGLDYPAPEWLELAGLSGDEELAGTIQNRFGEIGNAELGYRRGNICSNINGWRFSHSGTMHFERDDDGTLAWWNEERTINASTLSVRREDGAQADSEALLNHLIRNETDCLPVSLRNAQIAAAIQHAQIEENGEPLWQTRLSAALENEILILSIFYIDEADRDWATEICASVSR